MCVSTTKTLFSKSEIENLVKKKDQCLSYVKPSSAKSQYWDKFQEILVNNVRQGFIICNDCHSTLTWTPSDGTNVMKKYAVACIKTKDLTSETQPRITSLFKETSQVTSQQLRFFKKKVLRSAAEMCIMDSRPFNITHGKGFEEFCREVFNTGKYFGKMVDVKELLPHRTTISCDIDSFYLFYHEKLRDLCKKITSFAITVDFWTEEFSSVSFAGVALHFYEENDGLVSLILCCRAYDLEDATAPNVRLFVDQILSEFSLKLTDKQYVITDNEPKMKCSFKEDATRVGCSSDYLNKILEKSFTQYDSNCDEVQKLFETTRPIVTHFIRSHKQAVLHRRLQLYCKTRWNSIYFMFFTFNKNFHDLRILLDKNHQPLFDTIDPRLLRQLISFLKLFVDITELLSNEQQSTLHLALPCRQKLIQVAKKLVDDEHPSLIKFKKYFLQHIENDWPVQDEHYIATVLHPQFKQLETFNKKIRRHTHELVKNKLHNDLTVSSPSSTIITPTPTPSSSHCSDNSDLFSSLYDKPKDANKKSEFETYLNSHLRLQEGEDLLKFWMQQRENYPQLFDLAKQILIIPASNTCIERMFSVSGAPVIKRRTRLAIKKIDKIMFLNKNLAYLKSRFASNQKESSEEMVFTSCIPSKRALSMDLSKSYLQIKKRRQSSDDEIISSEQDEQIQSDNDEDIF